MAFLGDVGKVQVRAFKLAFGRTGCAFQASWCPPAESSPILIGALMIRPMRIVAIVLRMVLQRYHFRALRSPSGLNPRGSCGRGMCRRPD
jgi:hypothetical protein